MDLETLFTELKNYIEKVKLQFLKEHLDNPLASPDDFELAVKSFCILSHAAFEEFIEKVCLKVLSSSIDDYILQQRISKPLITLAHFKENSNDNFFTKDAESLTIDNIVTVFDYNREMLRRIKVKFSKEISDNHGISLKYLRRILTPLSLDIPREVNWINSLQKLAYARGNYAHRFIDTGRIENVIEPEEADTIVGDCLLLCEEIKKRAISIMNE